MPNTRSAAKRVRQSEKRHLRIQAIKSEIKTLVKKCRLAVEAGQPDEARQLARLAESGWTARRRRASFTRTTANRRAARLHKAVSGLNAGE